MPQRSSKSSKAKTKKSTKASCAYDPHPILLRPSTWVIAILFLGVIVIGALGALSLARYEHSLKTDLEVAELTVFDELASNFVQSMDIIDGKSSFNVPTGYGISDEDGVFYITFDFTPYTLDENHAPINEDTRHGIVYFWPDEERGGYSYAYSYHDDASYHPDGIYVAK